ncbi:MAG: hypothetical protein OXH99_15465 [Bryobacterales bacterium]|nr:hypothetical protein [Bryobacterales bacterium]
MSDALEVVEGINWICKGEGLSHSTVTLACNQAPEHIRRVDRDEGVSDLRDWFGGGRSLSVDEQVVGLDSYGKTLTVLTALDINEQIEELEEEEDLADSWTPRFRRR